jgi:hypothetical protein
MRRGVQTQAVSNRNDRIIELDGQQEMKPKLCPRCSWPVNRFNRFFDQCPECKLTVRRKDSPPLSTELWPEEKQVLKDIMSGKTKMVKLTGKEFLKRIAK